MLGEMGSRVVPWIKAARRWRSIARAMRTLTGTLLVFAVGSLIAACAGFRGGWESFAYIGDMPPPPPPESRTPHEAHERSLLAVPGLRLRVTIGNQLRTYDTQVYLYVLPLSIDPRSVPTRDVAPGRTRVYVNVMPLEPGFVFEPQRAVLSVAGKSHRALAGYEFGRWDAQGNRVTEGGRWEHRAIDQALPLDEVNRQYLLSIDFDTAAPSPQSRDIAVDLSHALRSPDRPPVPLIRFLPVRWKESYS
jgi:hypothetical protein